MFLRIGRFSYKYRWRVIAAWLILVAVSLPILPRVSGALAVGGFSSQGTESSRALDVLQHQIPGVSPSDLEVIFQSPTLTADSPEFQQQAALALSQVARLPHVTAVVPFTANPQQVAPDGHTAYSVIQLDLPPELAQRLVDQIRGGIQPTQLTVRIAGGPAFYADIEHVTERDLRRAELIAVPFALVALVLVFGSLVTAGVPLFVGGVSVAGVLGAIFVLAHVIDLSIFVLNLASLLGLGLAIDYSLFMTSRYREELAHGDVAEAVARTVATAGKTIFFSGVTVLIGLSGLAIFQFMFLRSVGIAGALVVLFAVSGALTLLPATLGVIGRRVDRFSLYRRGEERGAFWSGVADRVMRHPWAVLVPVVALLVVLGLPFRHVNLNSPDATILPTSTASRQAFEVLRHEYGDGAISPIVLAVQTRQPVTDPATLAALYRYTREIAADPGVWRVDSVVTVDPRLALEQYQALYADPSAVADPLLKGTLAQLAGPNATVITVYSNYLPASSQAKTLLAHIRGLNPGPELTVEAGGGTAEVVDVVHQIYHDFPIAILIVVAATYLTLLVQFRSVILPLKAVLMNALSILASYGALVWIFQDGHFSGLLGFTPLGFIEVSLPVVMFCLLFGLSMDYEVFLLSRMREEWERTGDNQAAVAAGLARSGRIITGAALILVLVAVSFVSADVVLIKALGLGIAIAVALDATVVRALLVPATMRLLGHRNWWAPDWVERRLPQRLLEH